MMRLFGRSCRGQDTPAHQSKPEPPCQSERHCTASSPKTDCDEDACYICLSEGTPQAPLLKVCACPRTVHSLCLARWNLQRAGTREETHCRFCDQEVPEWTSVITPEGTGSSPTPFMAIVYGGRGYRIPVKPGPDGLRDFKARVARLFHFPPEMDFDVAFECRSPVTNDPLTLQGIDAFSAAAHCAAVSAGKRHVHDSLPSATQTYGGLALRRQA